MNEPRLDVSAVTGGNWRGYLSEMGPSWVAGVVAAGPATMATVLTAGATFGYAMPWVVVLSAVLGASAQYLSMRLGLLTEDGIVPVVERELGDSWAWALVADVVLVAGLAQLVTMQGFANVSAMITGVDARVWGAVRVIALAAGLAGRDYRFVELLAKGLVAAVVVTFLASLVLTPIDPAATAGGLVLRIPSGVDDAFVAASVLGGAVHIMLITMHSYTMRARGWATRDYGLAMFDVGAPMLVAFGVYSLAVFLVAASVLHSPKMAAGDLTAVAVMQALGPIVGANVKWLFLLGLLDAAASTLGSNTVVPPFLVADKLGWGTDLSDDHYRALLAGVALFFGVGAFPGGVFFPLLVLVLAFGLVGTPFAIAVVLVLLNGDAVSEPNSTSANLGGVVLFVVTTVLAANFVRSRMPSDLGDPLSVFVVVFAAAMEVVTLGLLGKFVRETVGRPTTA